MDRNPVSLLRGLRINPEGDGALDPPGSNWLLWLLVTPQGWAAMADGPN